MSKLTYQQRKKLPKSAYVFPERAPEDGYLIHDRKHASNALSRVSAFGSSYEKAKVRAAVYRRYPELKKRKTMREHRRTAKGK